MVQIGAEVAGILLPNWSGLEPELLGSHPGTAGIWSQEIVRISSGVWSDNVWDFTLKLLEFGAKIIRNRSHNHWDLIPKSPGFGPKTTRDHPQIVGVWAQFDGVQTPNCWDFIPESLGFGPKIAGFVPRSLGVCPQNCWGLDPKPPGFHP